MSKSNVSFFSNRNHNIPLRPGSDLSGLFLSGQVIDRIRRTIQTRMDTSTRIVTYTIMDSSIRRYYIDEYATDEYHEICDSIIVPVYPKTFRKNNGVIDHSFAVQHHFVPALGEHFYPLSIRYFNSWAVQSFGPHSLLDKPAIVRKIGQLITWRLSARSYFKFLILLTLNLDKKIFWF